MPKFKKKPSPIEAVRLQHEMVMFGAAGEMHIVGRIGDWLLTRNDGTQFCLKNSKFMEQFEPVDEDAEEYLTKHGTVVIEPRDFEDVAADNKPVRNKLGEREHPMFAGSRFAMDAMEMLDKEKQLQQYKKKLYAERIKELGEQLGVDPD